MRKPSCYTWLLLLVVVEVISQTYLAAFGNKDLAAIVYVMAGIGIGLVPLLRRKVADISIETEDSYSIPWQRIAFGLLLVGISYFGFQAIKAQPLDYTFADMLPIINKQLFITLA